MGGLTQIKALAQTLDQVCATAGKDLVESFKDGKLGEFLHQLPRVNLYPYTSALCVTDGKLDKQCFVERAQNLWSQIFGAADLSVRFSTRGIATINLLTGSYFCDFGLVNGSRYSMYSSKNPADYWGASNWYEAAKSVYAIAVKIDDGEYYSERSSVLGTHASSTYFGSKRWADAISVSRTGLAVAGTLIDGLSSGQAVVNDVLEHLYAELEDIAIWLGPVAGATAFESFREIAKLLAAGKLEGPAIATIMESHVLTYRNTALPAIQNLPMELLVSFGVDTHYDLLKYADRHFGYAIGTKDIPVTQDYHKACLSRIFKAYQAGQHYSSSAVSAFFKATADLERTLGNIIAKATGLKLPADLLTFDKFVSRNQAQRDAQNIFLKQFFSMEDIEAMVRDYKGDSPIINLRNTKFAKKLSDSLEFLALGTKEKNVDLTTFDLDVRTALVTADVTLNHVFKVA